MKKSKSAATPFTKETTIGPWSGFSNEKICILAAQVTDNLPDVKILA